MAGDWLKMRHDLADDPAVIRMSAETGIDEDAVIGKLFRLWSWADRHTRDGVAAGIALAWVDRFARCDGFGAALVEVGWLVDDDAGLRFPRFDRHCSTSAKERAVDAARKAVSRGKNDDVREMSGPFPDGTRTREEKRERVPPPPPREATPEEPAGWTTLRSAWNAPASPGKPWRSPEPPDGIVDRLLEPGWLQEALEAIPRLRAAKFFATPVTLIQFGKPGFTRRIVGGQYDEPRGRPPGAGPPDKPSAEEASRRWRQKAEEQDRRRREREAEAAARREQAAASADEDEDYETVRSRLVAQLKEIDR